jgi:hypothetical protein
VVLSIFILLIACAAVSYDLATNVVRFPNPVIANNRSLFGTFSLIAAIIAITLVIILAGYTLARRRRLREKIADAALTYQLQLDTVVNEGIARAINEELGPDGIVAFPTIAPRLVELHTSNIVPSETVDIVKDFVRTHESSAIGLAGMRGSGKSTVMQALAADAELAPHVAVIPSPVKYDSAEFSRRLLTELATIISGESFDVENPRLANRVSLVRIFLSIGLMVVGAVCLFLGSELFNPTEVHLNVYTFHAFLLFGSWACRACLFDGNDAIYNVYLRCISGDKTGSLPYEDITLGD